LGRYVDTYDYICPASSRGPQAQVVPQLGLPPDLSPSTVPLPGPRILKVSPQVPRPLEALPRVLPQGLLPLQGPPWGSSSSKGSSLGFSSGSSSSSSIVAYDVLLNCSSMCVANY